MPTVALPPKVRVVIYYILAIAGVALTATQAVFAGEPQPTWLAISWAVYGALGAASGLTAASNTPVPRRALEE